MPERISRDEALMRCAEAFAARSTCERRAVGAIITDAAGLRILGVGYNGSPRGQPNRCERPTTPGRCGCIHAEVNAIAKADGTLPDKVLYTTTAPCYACAGLILNAGIQRVVIRGRYRLDDGEVLLRTAGLVVEYL